MSPTYVTPGELAALLSGPRSDGVVVVDVREADRVTGCVKGALHVPACTLHEPGAVDALVQQLRGKQMVVFHCHFSRQRGPAAAEAFAEACGRAAADAAPTSTPAIPPAGEAATGAASAASEAPPPRVAVLQGGWRAWWGEFGEDAALTERLDDSRDHDD